MSLPTMRRAIARRQRMLARCVGSVALFSTAGLVVANTVTHPSSLVAKPAALALTTPVAASSRPLALQIESALSSRPVALVSSDPSKDPTQPNWELANIANPRVDKWVKKFTTTLDEDFSAALDRGEAYSDMISEKLAARHMPQELYYLAMIESEFKPKAKSRVAAVGLWQFMASTARNFGLAVSRHVDERTNPAKATDAALAYLTELHDRFGSWYLAAAAYNSGPGTVSRALRKVTGRTTGSDADFYRISPKLPAETREYVPKLVAAARVGKLADSQPSPNGAQ
jgi:membrane-bound lytic murein transglycosylase D